MPALMGFCVAHMKEVIKKVIKKDMKEFKKEYF